MPRRFRPLALLIGLGLSASLPIGRIHAQVLFRTTAPVAITLTTNLRDIFRERDSTALRWFGAEMT